VVLALFTSPSRKLANELPQFDTRDELGWLVVWLLKPKVPAVLDWFLELLA
jgi:hypothetical protein